MWETFLENLRHTSYLEYAAFISLIFYVYYATRQKPVAWLLGMVGVTLFFIIDYKAKLYAELPLQALYFILSVYGWYEWKFGGKQQKPLMITRTSLNLWMVLIILGVVGTILIGYLLRKFSNSDVPFWDAGTTAFSLVGTWMLARKKLENWVLWFFVDAVYVWLFLYKSLVLAALLYFIYVIFSVIGFFRWAYYRKYGDYPK